MSEQKLKKNQRRLQGTVISNKMSKTAVVEVENTKFHPKYKKQYSVSKKYKVHDEKNTAVVGNKVIFEACRPLSKDKRWRLVKIVK